MMNQNKSVNHLPFLLGDRSEMSVAGSWYSTAVISRSTLFHPSFVE